MLAVVPKNKYVLGFTRLAINDLTDNGNQPFVFQDGDKTISLICNGEIYNHKELIQKYDLVTHSTSDCEVLYHLLKHHDYNVSKAIREVHGEFAFVVIIEEQDNINYIVARDPIGVRPLFFGSIGNGVVFSSLLSGLSGLVDRADVFPPGHFMMNGELVPYYGYNYEIQKDVDVNVAYREVTNRLVGAVKARLMSDRPIGCLLSGGLDSSLVAAILVRILGVKDLRTFSIGMPGSTDLAYARKVAEHLGTDHTEVYFTPEEALDAIPNVVLATESWDITTNRASIGQFLLAKYISENTDIKVIINGDGADEVELGYLYFYCHPSVQEAHKESVKLVKEIHRYDGLRVDRCLGYHGLEARIPFLDVNFVDYYMSLPIEWRVPGNGRMEKHFIRTAFASMYPDILPNEVLYRKKEAFSDGVSSTDRSLFEYLKEDIDQMISDDEFNRDSHIYEYCTPKTKEAYCYRKLFDEYFGDENAGVIPHFWLPNWIDTKGEPSARVLSVY
jgi:asparagine synthase (glutamine-hydrolysing)